MKKRLVPLKRQVATAESQEKDKRNNSEDFQTVESEDTVKKEVKTTINANTVTKKKMMKGGYIAEVPVSKPVETQPQVADDSDITQYTTGVETVEVITKESDTPTVTEVISNDTLVVSEYTDELPVNSEANKTQLVLISENTSPSNNQREVMGAPKEKAIKEYIAIPAQITSLNKREEHVPLAEDDLTDYLDETYGRRKDYNLQERLEGYTTKKIRNTTQYINNVKTQRKKHNAQKVLIAYNTHLSTLAEEEQVVITHIQRVEYNLQNLTEKYVNELEPSVINIPLQRLKINLQVLVERYIENLELKIKQPDVKRESKDLKGVLAIYVQRIRETPQLQEQKTNETTVEVVPTVPTILRQPYEIKDIILKYSTNLIKGKTSESNTLIQSDATLLQTSNNLIQSDTTLLQSNTTLLQSKDSLLHSAPSEEVEEDDSKPNFEVLNTGLETETQPTTGSIPSTPLEKVEEPKQEEEKPNSDIEGVVYERGMSVLEFLRANPSIRKKADVVKYFSTAEIKIAIKHGEVYPRKDTLRI